ncbi:MAG: hypothetical protein AAFY65_09790 [Pseudomonadota bacterium]
MTRFFLTAVTATLLAAPAFADRLDIDDDGWKMVPATEETGLVVDIDDDGWSQVSPQVTVSGRNVISTPGNCTQLEYSAGLSGAECGVFTLAQITKMMGDN